jgi:DNA-binding MarR family transcriptional regulator
MMLEKLLRLVAEGGVHSQDELMEVLWVSRPLLEAMLDSLTKLGYLRSVDDGCGERCAACPVGKCSVAGPGRLWSLTEKGAKAAAQLPA